MEVAIIDWQNLDSRFVRDDVYEHINAPQWFDFSAPEAAIDDESWFCRPDCNHPKSLEDLYRQTPSNSKKSSSGLSKRLPFAELTGRRDSNLKKRGLAAYALIFPNDSKSDTNTFDSENQNPNFLTPLNHKSKVYKEKVKSSSPEKKEQINEKAFFRKEQSRRSLKSTLSARNLFSEGGDMLSKVTEFCTELKKLTLRKKYREEHKEEVVCVDDCLSDESQKIDVKETKPLLDEANSKNRKALPEGNLLKKPPRKIRYEDKNTPIKVDVKIIKSSEQENLVPIRICPPTPQCISAIRGPSKASPLKEINPIMTTPESGIHHHQDTGYRKPNWKKEQGSGSASTTVTAKEAAKGLDVFWFLKPCRFSS